MFEAVILLCLGLSDEPCRSHLLTGYEALTEADCEAALAARPPDIGTMAEVQSVTAKGPAECRPAGLALPVTEVAPDVFVHMGQVAEPDPDNRGDVSNLGFIVGQDSVAVIDSGGARWIGEALWRAIRRVTDKPVSHVILTHMHPDHVLGAALIAEGGAAVVGHAGLARALADRQANYRDSLSRLIGVEAFLGTGVAPVDVAVTDRIQIDLGGGRVLDLRAWPVAHTGTDLTVLDTMTGTLFAGDLVFHRHLPALDGRLTGWQAVLSDLAEQDIARVVPGHGGPVLDWPAGAADMQRYLGVLERDTRAALDAGQRLGRAVETIAAEERDKWELFDAYNPRNATVAFTELEWE